MSLTRLPGMIDAHTHLRDPGATQKEDFYTGTCAALAGGVTMILDMPNNPIPTISFRALKNKQKIASEKAVCDYGLIFGASQEDNTEEFKKIIPKVAALKVYMDQTTGTLLVEKLGLLEKIFRMWRSEKPIMVHAEDATLAKAISLSAFYKKHVHFCHVSLADEVELIKRAKEQKIKISAEATPHHLFLTENDRKRLGPFGIMKPPLRSVSDVQALWHGLIDGTIDMVATDHAPHTMSEKKSNKPPFGVTGLETALPLLLTVYKQKKLTLDQVIKLYHHNPRKIFNLPTQKNTYIMVDLDNKYELKNKDLKTKCGWSPFAGWQLYGKVHEVVLRGKTVYKNGKILAKKGYGKNIIS
ncbi:amidohydrolase family protein [Candidatus Gottesmanbacteria bacterium]|nr:amidohydrolase family protein [Candidatus Gottesmanbacteria bacterium]